MPAGCPRFRGSLPFYDSLLFAPNRLAPGRRPRAPQPAPLFRRPAPAAPASLRGSPPSPSWGARGPGALLCAAGRAASRGGAAATPGALSRERQEGRRRREGERPASPIAGAPAPARARRRLRHCCEQERAPRRLGAQTCRTRVGEWPPAGPVLRAAGSGRRAGRGGRVGGASGRPARGCGGIGR